MAKHDYSFFGLSNEPANSLAEAGQIYGMDFEVEKCPLYYADAKGNPTRISPWDEQVVNVDKNRAPIGVVGIGYQIVRHLHAFDIAQPLIDAGAHIVGGGCPNNGERAYLVLQTDQKLEIAPGDCIVNRYLLLNSYDGTGKIEVRFTPYRSTYGIAFTTNANRPLAFKHTRNVAKRLTLTKRVFRGVNENWNQFSDSVKKMLAISLNQQQATEFVEAVMPATSDEPSTRLENQRAEVMEIYHKTGIGTRMPQCRGTLFGLVQAFAEWADIHRTVRKSKKRDDIAAALDTRLVADSAKKKAKAFAVAVALTKLGNKTQGVFTK